MKYKKDYNIGFKKICEEVGIIAELNKINSKIDQNKIRRMKMAKKIETKAIGIESIEKFDGGGNLNIIEDSRNAFSILYNGNKKYSVVSIPINGGEMKVIESDLDFYEAQHAFKAAVVNGGLFDQGIDKNE